MAEEESNSIKDRPVFIPPRKRQVCKKINGSQTYVDHIVPVQVKPLVKLSPTSPSAEGNLTKTPNLLKNKNQVQKFSKATKTPSATNITLCDNYKPKGNELKSFDNIAVSHSVHLESSTVTPSSCCSESSLDTKLSKSFDCLTNNSTKKRVNIQTDTLPIRSTKYPLHYAENTYEELESGETSVLNAEDGSFDCYSTRRSADSYLTMTGTIKRGRKKGQSVDLQINMSREELEKINAVALATEVTKTHNLCCVCTATTGLHVLLLSIACLPFVILFTGIYSFYIGTLTWYNVFTYFNEEKSFFYRLIMSPILILTYPFAILVCTLGLGIYAGFIQLSMQLTAWLNEIADVEKGFFGWLCGVLKLSDCSPYEVVILTDLPVRENHVTVHSSMEELTL